MKKFNLLSLSFLALMLVFSSCSKEDETTDVPPVEVEEEIITEVKLTFTNDADATDKVIATAVDPDGEGVKELEIVENITLKKDVTYTLSVEAMNTLETPAEDITEEIREEAAEHQLFFAFTNDAFTNPLGDGNADNAADAVNYLDKDANDNPLGLSTSWSTAETGTTAGTFRVVLKHQPDVKTSTSSINDGDTDFDLTFELNIQ